MLSNISIFNLPYLTTAFVLSFAISFLICAATASILRNTKARSLIAAPILSVIFLAPWWSALAGAIVGHCFALMLINVIRKERSSEMLKLALIAALFPHYLYTAHIGEIYDSEIAAIKKDDKARFWNQIVQNGEAGKFVFDNFRTCSSSTVICQNSLIQLASSRGDEFQLQVEKQLRMVVEQGDYSSDAKQKIAALRSKFIPS